MQQELDARQYQINNQQDVDNGRSIVLIIINERILIIGVDERANGGQRNVRLADNQIDAIENLCSADHENDGCKKQRWREQWERDGTELAESGCAVDLGRLIQRARNPLKTGKDQQHVKTDRAPHADHDEGIHREPLIRNPRDMGAKHGI